MSLDKFTQDGQEPKVVEKIYNKILTMLNHDEIVSYIALQKKPAVTLLPDSIAISNKRIFLCEFTKLGLATNFEIFDWKDIKDIAFKEEIFGSKVTVIPFTGENLSIDFIPKTQARRLYQLIKELLEEIKSKSSEDTHKPVVEAQPVVSKPVIPLRNVYEETTNEVPPPRIEETPKSFEPIVSQQTHVSSVENVHEEDDELTLKLKKLKNLYDKQLISQAEYENKKSEILSQL